MRFYQVKPVSFVKGKVIFFGDKSIAHRSIIISALSQGQTKIKNLPFNKDCLYTVKALQKLGIKITRKSKNEIIVYGKGLRGLTAPIGCIFAGDSGTTFRLLLGVLAGQDFKVRLTAGNSLSQRPMRRVTEPLRMMGAKISSKRKTQNSKFEEYPPLTIKGGGLKPITYKLPVASAQVKSAILLAGLFSKGLTQVIEPVMTRDHTERMLVLFKADIKPKGNKIVIKGNKELVSPGRIYIPGDISSGSFFMVLASILPNSRILMPKISLNPTRLGIIKVLKRMGADIRTINPALPAGRHEPRTTSFEPMGNLIVKSSILKGTIVKKEEIPSLIDELPILMVAACYAKGKTVIEGVGELRVKETDRIKSMYENLKKMGADIQVIRSKKSEKIIIKGVKQLVGAKVRSFDDHRTAMSMVIAGITAKGETFIDDVDCINKSFPNFLNILTTLTP